MIAHQSPYFDFAMSDVLIDQPLFHLDFQWDHLETVRKKHPDITAEVHDGEATWTLRGCNDPDVLQKIIETHDILDVDGYLTRAEAKQDQARTSSSRTIES